MHSLGMSLKPSEDTADCHDVAMHSLSPLELPHPIRVQLHRWSS